MPNDTTLTSALPVEQLTASVAEFTTEITVGCEVPTAANLAIPASTIIERYVLGAEIARGGMGAVYRATDTAFDREVAVKVLLDKYASASDAARRFHDEARITGQLQHPGIPPVHDLGTLHDGRPFLAMKLIKGGTLENLLKLRANPNEDRGRFVAAFEQVCQAVAYAHAHGVIHRDLKPANVMIGNFGEVQVMDWGLAKVLASPVGYEAGENELDVPPSENDVKLRYSEDLLTRAGIILGTPAYMPPEQAMGAGHEVDARSDVFGLGAILAVILTGRSPFVGDSAEANLVMAALGEVQGCFDRLDGCEADPGLVALAKRCLAARREDRPADAGVMANEVAVLRAAADDRARQAEVELATAAAANAERRKRRRVWLGAAVALTVALVGGLGSVLAVQRRANSDMVAANGKLAAKNDALVDERAKVEQRFEMARKAIAAFHTTIDEQQELGNEAFRPLRKKLLMAAGGFYRELEGLLAGETDAKSRSALAEGYFQLANLSEKVGDQTEALAMYRKSLALRKELAAAPKADVEARLAMAAALAQVGFALRATGDTVGALRDYEEARDQTVALAAEEPSDSVRAVLARCHHSIGSLLKTSGRPIEALASYEKALNIRQTLADANPAAIQFQTDLAHTNFNLAIVLFDANKPVEALEAYEKVRDIHQKQVDADPGVTEFQTDLAMCHINIGYVLSKSGKTIEALAAYQNAREIYQTLADANPAVNMFQSGLALSHGNIASRVAEIGKPVDALASYEKARDIRQKLVDANPAVTDFQVALAKIHSHIGKLQGDTGQSRESLAAYQRARNIYQELTNANPTVPSYRADLASTENSLGIVPN